METLGPTSTVSGATTLPPYHRDRESLLAAQEILKGISDGIGRDFGTGEPRRPSKPAAELFFEVAFGGAKAHPASALRAVGITFQPPSRSTCAVAAPIPDEQPVTRTFLVLTAGYFMHA